MYNTEGDDDDCKYHVRWTSTEVAQNEDVRFAIVLTRLADGSAATGATPYIEAAIEHVHGAPTTNQQASETAPGQYDIGPVRFDQRGRWTVRFHVYPQCADEASDSPHGHAAFFLDVP